MHRRWFGYLAAISRNLDKPLTTATDYHYKEETKTRKSFLKKTTTHKVKENTHGNGR